MSNRTPGASRRQLVESRARLSKIEALRHKLGPKFTSETFDFDDLAEVFDFMCFWGNSEDLYLDYDSVGISLDESDVAEWECFRDEADQENNDESSDNSEIRHQVIFTDKPEADWLWLGVKEPDSDPRFSWGRGRAPAEHGDFIEHVYEDGPTIDFGDEVSTGKTLVEKRVTREIPCDMTITIP
nr:hypothetical protein [Candidatus Sigynarchaeota archaeon]